LKQELLDFQARWMRPAGICAILGALVFAVSLPIQPSSSGDNDAERLTTFHKNATELIVGQGIMIGIAVLLFMPLLYVLIRSVIGRTERVRRWMVALAFIGPVLFSVSGVIVAFGLTDVADKFVDQAPAKEQEAREQASAAGKAPAKGGAAKPATTTTAQSTTTTPRTPEQAAGKARDDLASDLIDDSGALQAGSLVRFIGLISLVFAMIYIPLWCMRTGLLTRFWAYLGLALGIALLLVPIGIFGLVLWFALVGLMIAGWWPRPLPPAWAAGEAIPWPRPGEESGPPPAAGGPGTVEGSGREVSEQPLPENGDAEQPAQPGETQGERRKKRKRRQ
jgi:hypothetical protein